MPDCLPQQLWTFEHLCAGTVACTAVAGAAKDKAKGITGEEVAAFVAGRAANKTDSVKLCRSALAILEEAAAADGVS